MTATSALAEARIAILGLGLMGGSLALALRGKCAALFGVDPDPATLSLALARQVVDAAAPHPSGIVSHSDVVILAAPVRITLELIRDLPALHPGSPVVLDLGSTKVQICQALGLLPERFDPIGGHPMCGKETASLANADPEIYHGARFALTPLARTTPRARGLAESIASAVGSHPIWINPETHDRWVAATSHLPYLVANALAGATPEDAAPLVGPGFRSTTRLAVTPTTMMLDVLATNQDNLLAALKHFRSELDILEGCLEQGELEELRAKLEQSGARQKRLVEPLD